MKKNETLFKSIGNVDNWYIEEAAPGRLARVGRVGLKWLGIAVCVCLIFVVIGILTNWGESDANAPVSLPGPLVFGDAFVDDPGSASVCWPAPEDGQVVRCFSEELFVKYPAENAFFFLGIGVFQSGNPTDEAGERDEIKRLAALGYRVGTAESWQYIDPEIKLTYQFYCGYFTRDEIDEFQADTGYGYAFYIPADGDGGAVHDESFLVMR